jgi:hypothetical protein
MKVAVWLLAQAALIGAIVYLFLNMEWIEDRSVPFAVPREVGPHRHYISEPSFRG